MLTLDAPCQQKSFWDKSLPMRLCAIVYITSLVDGGLFGKIAPQ
jgi:hypothetical protein